MKVENLLAPAEIEVKLKKQTLNELVGLQDIREKEEVYLRGLFQ